MRLPLIFLAVLALAGCGSSTAEEPAPGIAEGPPPLEQVEDGNLTLYVSNQSFERDDVDILVFIDGRPAVDDSFDVGNQHNWIEFSFDLADGKHTLYAESVAGEAVFEESFEMAAKRWAVIDYWCCDSMQDEPKFSFHLSSEPIGFA
ncbi:MAG: hypothetical protein WD027_05535 [Gaiellales bacterium]